MTYLSNFAWITPAYLHCPTPPGNSRAFHIPSILYNLNVSGSARIFWVQEVSKLCIKYFYDEIWYSCHRIIVAGNFHIKYSRINQQFQSFSRSGNTTRIWNNKTMREQSEMTFKCKLHKLLFQFQRLRKYDLCWYISTTDLSYINFLSMLLLVFGMSLASVKTNL